MKKKSVVKFIATIFVLLTGLILFSPKSVSASAITIKAAFDKKYYNVNSTKKAYGNWVGNVTFFTRHLKVNTGKPTFFTPSIYVVNKKATGLSAKEDGIYINNIDHKRFVHGRVYLMRFRFDLSHLKPGKKYRFKNDMLFNNPHYAKYRWFTQKASRKGNLSNSTHLPQVDLYVNCGAKKSFLKKVMHNNKKIVNSKIKLY